MDLEGALLAGVELAEADNIELVARQGEGSQVGLVTMVGFRFLFGGLRCRLLFSWSWKGASRVSAGGEKQGCQDKNSRLE